MIAIAKTENQNEGVGIGYIVYYSPIPSYENASGYPHGIFVPIESGDSVHDVNQRIVEKIISEADVVIALFPEDNLEAPDDSNIYFTPMDRG